MKGEYVKSGLKPVALMAVLAAAGCDTIFGDGYEVTLRTDENEYLVSAGTKLSVSVENRSDKVVYYLCAGEISLERLEGGKFVDRAGFGNCDCLCPNPIEAGEKEDREYELNEYMRAWINDGLNTNETTYRFRLVLYEDRQFEAELDDSDQLSNEFTISFPVLE